MNWWKELKNIKRNEPLNNKTTFKIGGKADFFVEPKDPVELKRILSLAADNGLPVFILGGGSNLLIAPKRLKAIVVRLNSPFFKKIILRGNMLEVGAGVMLGVVAFKAKERVWSGAEFLAGIPGTLGGALCMNAGAWGGCIGELVKEVTVMDYRGRLKIIKSSGIRFGYRDSSLRKYIILSCCLRFKKGNKTRIQKKMSEYAFIRRETQGTGGHSAGCVFKNPKGFSAGRLIDACGLKGKGLGDAYISNKHANFILNKNKASASDVLRLMHLVQAQVKNKFNIVLEPEIKIWP